MSGTLFELDDRTGPADVTHVLMPNMAYTCGGNILTVHGHVQVGVRDWSLVTCAECQAIGEQTIRDECRAQQGRQAGAA